MRVLLLGAGGFIGSAVRARLRHAGHRVTAVVRRAPPADADAVVRLDLRQVRSPEDWAPHLAGIDAVVNCAGVLQDSPRDSTRDVHVRAVDALFAACERAGIRRVIHISAIGVDRGALTPFSQTKLEGDAALMARDLDWVILRPSVVVGRNAYGGSAMLRALAALPVLPLMPDTGPLQLVQLDDVAATVVFFLDPAAPARVTLEVAGPERLAFGDIVATYRHWLGTAPARVVAMPRWLAGLLYRAGDLAGWLGWRPPLRSTARREITRGAVGDASDWMRLTRITPQSLGEALAAEPSGTQDRWFARLYLLKPLVLVVFALFWIGTGLISLGPGWETGIAYLAAGGVFALAPAGVIAGALADIAIGVAMLFRRTARTALWGALAISLFYVVAGTLLVPWLWADPLGPMLKIWPVLMLNLVALAIVEDR